MITELVYVSPTEDCPHPEYWESIDAQASECAVGTFLAGLVAILQPNIVIETGTYLGYTAKTIAEALKANTHGWLYTCDTNEAYVYEAREKLYDKGLPVNVLHMKGEDLCARHQEVDLAFIDSGGDRLQEAKTLRLAPHGVVVLHDSRNRDYVRFATATGWQEMFFPTPRGISIFKQKEYAHAPETTYR